MPGRKLIRTTVWQPQTPPAIIPWRRNFRRARDCFMKTSIETLLEDVYPSSDGKPMAETQVHVRLLTQLLGMLEYHFRRREDVLVAGNIFLYYEEGKPNKRRSPDVMVVKGIKGKPLSRSFMTSIERTV